VLAAVGKGMQAIKTLLRQNPAVSYWGCWLTQFDLYSGHELLMYVKGKGSPYLITEHRVRELIPVLGSQPAGDVSHIPGGRLPISTKIRLMKALVWPVATS